MRRYIRMTCIVLFLAGIFLGPPCLAITVDEVKDAEKGMIIDKKAAAAKEKAMLEEFYHAGERLMSENKYQEAMEQFMYVLEIDPQHGKAKSWVEKISQIVESQAEKEKRASSPQAMANALLTHGKNCYRKGDYDAALKDFQNALTLDYENDEIFEWTKRTRRAMVIDEAKTEEKDNIREIEMAAAQKGAHEKSAMLEVEKAYLPPAKPERAPVEIEEVMSDEDAEGERARRELLEVLKKKMVPAVSLTDADIRDVIRQLMDVTGTTIIIDEGALAKAVGTQPLRVTFTTVTPMPLLELLDIALRATEMAYKVEPNYIWVSSKDKLSEENLVTRTYRLKFGVRRRRKVELKEFETTSSSSSSSSSQ